MQPQPISSPFPPVADTARIQIAILGAGKASRFGGGKITASCAGKPLGQWALDAALGTGLPVLWVAGDTAPAFAARCELRHNLHAEQGMGTSVALAAQFAAETGADALLIMLADMPLTDTALLARLIAARAPAAVRHADGRAGVPALLPARSFGALQALTGDRGAGPVLASLPDLTLLDASPTQLIDVDCADDLAIADRHLRHIA